MLGAASTAVCRAASLPMSGRLAPAGTATAVLERTRSDFALRHGVTAGNQFVDGITGQQHHVQRLTGLYALCRIHPANRFNRHWLTACGLPSNSQIGQHLARGPWRRYREEEGA